MKTIKIACNNLFAAPKDPFSFPRIILWWELRRIPYNLILAGFGIASILVFYFCISLSVELKPGEDAVEPLALILGVVLVPVLANIFYTAGWIVDGFLRYFFSFESNLSPFLLKVGIGFSIFIVTLPAIFWAVICILGMVAQAFHLVSKLFT